MNNSFKSIATLAMALIFGAMACLAQHNHGDVEYIEKIGNGNFRVFSVTVVASKDIKSLETEAKRLVVEKILFDGVENYNQGMPLVAERLNVTARGMVDPKNNAFSAYCPVIEAENSNTKRVAHYIVKVNHGNLLRSLERYGLLATPFTE